MTATPAPSTTVDRLRPVGFDLPRVHELHLGLAINVDDATALARRLGR